MGNWGELTANDGALSLALFGRTGELYAEGGVPLADRKSPAPADYLARYTFFGAPRNWSNANISPDFPTVASVFADQYAQTAPSASNTSPVDGVISADPVALQALLGVLGPLEVKGWDEPLTGENTARVLMHDSYVRQGGESPERLTLLSDVTLGVWQKLTAASLPSPKALADALAPSAQRRHLQVWMRDPAEQRYIDRIGISGAVPPVQGDSLGIVLNNMSESKIDYFLHRKTIVTTVIDPTAQTVRTTVELQLENRAPADGEPAYILGSGNLNPVGSLRYYVSIYSALPLTRAKTTLDGQPMDVSNLVELGRNAYAIWFVVPNGKTSTLRFELAGTNPSGPGRYRLDYFGQATVNDEPLDFTVMTADGSVLQPMRGFGSAATDLGQTLRFQGSPRARETFEVALKQ
jgi:hypothetical protein